MDTKQTHPSAPLLVHQAAYAAATHKTAVEVREATRPKMGQWKDFRSVILNPL